MNGMSVLPDLPVAACVPALSRRLAQGHAVLTAEPGSGKTTLVPLMLLDAPWLEDRRIVMLEPRRPAARMAAHRMAQLLGEAVGERVGYQVRFERKVTQATRIEVLTEGLLLRRLQSDPELSGIGLVIFDEFHERSLTADLSLALCLDACTALRDDLRLLAMSATLDAAPLAALMGAEVLNAAGHMHDVALHYTPRDPVQRDPVDACTAVFDAALAASQGDLLIFVPGRRELEALHARLVSRAPPGFEVLTLFGDMPTAAQDKVLRGRAAARRIIIATDIAESSLTIEGVDVVIDSGLARRPRFDPNTGLTRLETVWVSRASATQRAGRAGRLGPGHCFRTWSEARHARLEENTLAEIVEADLATLVLELASWGVDTADALRWLDPPPPARWAQAVQLLQLLGALDAQARITPCGRRMAQMPAHPRLAHMLTAASPLNAPTAADLAALVGERDVIRVRAAADRTADVDLRLAALAALRSGDALPANVDRGALRRVDKAAAQLLRGVDAQAQRAVQHGDAGALLAAAFPDRVARCTSADGRRYLLRNGRAAMLSDNDPLRGSRYLAIASLDAGRRDGTIWLAAVLPETTFDALFEHQIEDVREVRWDDGLGDVVARHVRRLDAIPLVDEAVALAADDPAADVVMTRIRTLGIEALFTDAVELRARVELMRALEPDAGWPDCSDIGLRDSVEQWLPAWLKPGQGIRQLASLSLDEILRAWLGWDRVQRLEQSLPTHFDTPAGTRRRISYMAGAEPVIAIPLQEVLGLQRGPVLADGRVLPVLHLLSPAGRPLQVTRDLAAFWQGAYVEVKKEMRGRYPKHFWPDDPATAQATRFTKRRM